LNSLSDRCGWDRTGPDPIQPARDRKSSHNRQQRASISRRGNSAPVVFINSFSRERHVDLAISLSGRFAFQLEAPAGHFKIFSNVNDQQHRLPKVLRLCLAADIIFASVSDV
jgi:hypothetical protein